MTSDPRIDPWPGDVLRHTWRGAEVVTRVESFDAYTLHMRGYDPERRRLLPDVWRDWSGVDGGVNGVQILHLAEVAYA